MPLTTEKDAWVLIEPFVREYPADAIQLHSYNDFVENRLRKIIDENGFVNVKMNDRKQYRIELYGVNYVLPYHMESLEQRRNVFPVEACERSITYASDVLCTMRVTTYRLLTRAERLELWRERCATTFSYELAMQIDDETLTDTFMDVDGVEDRVTTSSAIHDNVCVGKIPVMVGSSLCNLTHIAGDPSDQARTRECTSGLSGIFIINGNQKFIVSQERSSFNRTCLFTNQRKKPNYTSYAQIRTSATATTHTTILNVGVTKDGLWHASTPFLPEEMTIPLMVLFRALDAQSDEDIMRAIVDRDDPMYQRVLDTLLLSFENTYTVSTPDEAREWLTRITPKGDAERMLAHEIFPTLQSYREKMYHLGAMTRRCLELHFGIRTKDDRDLYSAKRIDTVGVLMSNLLYTGVKKVMNDVRKMVERNAGKANFSFSEQVQAKTITKMFVTALSTGNWSTNKVAKKNKSGVSQNYEQFNYQMRVINLRKLTAPINVDGSIMAPRRLHASHFGIVDPADTPEGEHVGLNKVFGSLVYVTIERNDLTIDRLIHSYDGFVPIAQFDTMEAVYAHTRVYVNGRWVGSCFDGRSTELYATLRRLKLQCDIAPDTGIVHDQVARELRVSTDGGRIVRPYLIVERGQLLCTRQHITDILRHRRGWAEIISSGIVEMLDPDELEHCQQLCESLHAFDALSPDERMEYTYCDIHPATILGPGSAMTPWVQSNQGPRNSYQCNMCKQAVGIPYMNFREMMCGMCHVLLNGQRPLVSSKLARRIYKYEDMPSGVNAVVAIAPFEGINQEDSNIINKASIDRGLFQTCKYVTHEEKIMRHKNEQFEAPSRETCDRFCGGDTRHLETDVCVSPGDMVTRGDVLIGKVRVKSFDEISAAQSRDKDGNPREVKPYVDASLVLKDMDMAQVVKVQRGFDAKNFEYIRVQLVEMRIPEVGDKFATAIAQKSTTGRIVPASDLPFSGDPYSAPQPDILLNPLAFPSRMTIGNLIELVLGRKCSSAHRNRRVHKDDRYEPGHARGNCTPFEHLNTEEIMDAFEEMGYRRDAKEFMMDGRTGKPMRMLIFMGPMYVQRLKHMVRDKMHARARGPMQLLCRQPTEGKRSRGGLRVGEMERDALLSQSTSHLLKDRLLDNSDAYECHVCRTCGLLAVANPEVNRYECAVCEVSEIKQIRLAYAVKVVIQYLMSTNVVPRILVDEKSGEYKVKLS